MRILNVALPALSECPLLAQSRRSVWIAKSALRRTWGSAAFDSKRQFIKTALGAP